MIRSMPEGQTVHTRASLLDGLKAGDEDRWHKFHRLYGPVIRGFALKAGCNETEAGLGHICVRFKVKMAQKVS